MTGDSFSTWDGIEFTVLSRPAASADPLVMEFSLPAGCGSPPPHVHDSLTETYEVLEGTLEMLDGDEWRALESGQSFAIEPGMRHSFRNDSGATVMARNTHEPHGDFEPFIRSYAALSNEMQSAEPRSPKRAIQGARLWEDYPQMGRVTDQPMRALFPVLAAIGKLLRIAPPNPA